MSYWGGWGFYPRHVTVEERKQKAKKQLAALIKKGMALDPVTIEGRTIAKSWWGAHWTRNLERYADYAYRLDRGRSYVRSGAVLDLKIKNGFIQAIVAGSGRKPYEVKITIKRLNPEKWKALVVKTSGQIETVSGLLEGVFPAELGDLFFAENKGLFPAPKEIRFACSCPDFASLCKHTAAALYGTGARLDKQPALFFTLRDVKMEELVGKAAAHAAGRLLSRAARAEGSAVKKGRILKLGSTGAGGISEMFGIAVDAPPCKNEKRAGKAVKNKRLPDGHLMGKTIRRRVVR
jgi:uncharacterized Zn finger protein